MACCSRLDVEAFVIAPEDIAELEGETAAESDAAEELAIVDKLDAQTGAVFTLTLVVLHS
jgi:hypothetical protein